MPLQSLTRGFGTKQKEKAKLDRKATTKFAFQSKQQQAQIHTKPHKTAQFTVASISKAEKKQQITC